MDDDTDQLISIDPDTAAASTVGAVGFEQTSGLAYRADTATLFGSDVTTGQLIAIATTPGVGTPIGSIGLAAC